MRHGVNLKGAIVAKRYAQAFINIFLDTLSLQDYDNMQRASTSINKQVLFFLRLSALDYSVKKNALYTLSKRFKLPLSVQNLLHVLLRDNRAFLICDVLRYVCSLYRRYKHILEFAIISSHPLTKDEIEVIKHFLAQMTGQDIMYVYKIDKELIAGIRLQSDTFLWEYSICQRLNEAKLLLCPVRGI